MARLPRPHVRHLVAILGDQLDPKSAALDGLDVQHDAVWMVEAAGESTHVWSQKARIALFLSSMRRYRDALGRGGIRVSHRQLDDTEPAL